MPSTAPAGFIWRETSCGVVLHCCALEGITRHFFTTRSLDLGSGGDGDAGWRLVAETVGVHPEKLQRLVQVHGAGAVVIPRTLQPARRLGERPTADLLATDSPPVALAIQVADCVPILLADGHGRAVAAAHAGWRGTAKGIAKVAVGVLGREFGIPASTLIAAIGPSIGPCCYQVGAELRDAFLAEGHDTGAVGRWFSDAAGSAGTRLDLWRANADQLVEAGVRPSNIYTAGLCTVTRADLFYSYRRDGVGTGRMAAVIRCAAGSAQDDARAAV